MRYQANLKKSMLGVDVIAFRLHPTGPSKDMVAFSEVKASKDLHYGNKEVFTEIQDLVEEGKPKREQKVRQACASASDD